MNSSNKICSVRKILLLLTVLFTGFILLNSCSKKPQKVYRIGIVSGADSFADIANGFKAKMTELGYVEDKNVFYDFHKLNADHVGVERAVRKFIKDKVDLILAFPTEPALAAKAATKGTNIPVVFALAGIEGNNLVDSILKPGGNITGIRFPGPEATVKRLEILHELVPHAKRIYLIYDPNYPTAPTALEELHQVAPSLGITLVEDCVNNMRELQATLQVRAASSDIGIDAILIMPEILTQSPEGWEIIRNFAIKYKVPIGGSLVYTAEHGAMFSFIPDNLEMGNMAAPLADKILKGTPAGSIMVATPPSRLRLNYKVTQELGVTVPEGMLSRADKIIR